EDLEIYVGFWQKTGAGQGWLTGNNFALTGEIIGIPGATSTQYRVLAKTDSGIEILSDVLTVATAPDALSLDNFVRLHFAPARNSGFIEFDIFRKRAGVFYHVYSVRNDTTLS